MTRRNDVAVGVVVLLGIILVVFGTIWLKGAGLGRHQTIIKARFRSVGQLLDGNAVKLRGVPIGQVKEIALEPSGAAVVVTMSIGSEVRLPENPVVLLAPESMFGDWQAEIFPYSNYPYYDYLESPDPTVLPGYALPDMSRLTAVASDIAQNMKTLSDRVELAFTEQTARNIREAIENIQAVSQQLTGLVGKQQQAIEEVANNLQTTTQALDEAAGSIRRTFDEAEQAMGGGRLMAIMDNVQRATARSDSLADLLLLTSRELRTTAASADTTFRTVGAVVSSIQRGEGSLGLLLRDTSLYRGLVETSAEIQQLLQDIRKNPRRYINVRVF